MADTTTTTQTSVVNSEYITRAREAARGVSIFAPGMPGRMQSGIVDVVQLAGRNTLTASWPIRNNFTAQSVTEGSDYATNQAYTPTDTTVSVTEIIAIETVSDLAMMTGDENAIARSAEMLGIALGEKIDTDVLALNTSLDSDVGSTGAAATFELFANGRQTLGANRYPGPYSAILHDIQWYDMSVEGSTRTHQAAGVIADQILTNYEVFKIAGTIIIVSPRVPSANTAADRSGAIYSGWPCYGLAEMWWGRIEEERDASLRGTEVVGTSCYGVVEIDGSAGVAFETDL